MNDLVKFGGGSLPANPDELAKGLANVSQGISSSGSGVAILRLLRSGQYAYGQENIEPEPGVRWAINPYSLHHGFCCWVDSELLGEVMVPFNSPMPNPTELPDYGGTWNQQVSLNLMCMEGEDKGVTVVYKGSSNGLRNAVKKLIDALLSQLQIDSKKIVPIVELDTDSYEHKKYGQIHFPVLSVLAWTSIESGDLPEETEEEEPQNEETKPRRSRGGAKKEEAPEADDTDAVADEMEGKTETEGRGSRRRRGGNTSEQAPPTSSRRRRRAS